MIQIEINNVQSVYSVEPERLETAIRSILAEETVCDAMVSLAIVDDTTIRRLNRQYLAHDCPTDVLSFLLEQHGSGFEGEVIVSAETAAACGPRLGWPAADELLLYVVHGVLHLLGYDDQSPADRIRMRARERHHLARLGLQPPDPDEPLPPLQKPSPTVCGLCSPDAPRRGIRLLPQPSAASRSAAATETVPHRLPLAAPAASAEGERPEGETGT